MKKNDLHEFLAKLTLFNALTEDELAVISSPIEEKQYQPGEYIYRDREPSNSFSAPFEIKYLNYFDERQFFP